MAPSRQSLRLTVWEFVRLMVALEDKPRREAMAEELKRLWGEAWAEIDAELARLASADPDAYAVMMMDRETVLPGATPPRRRYVASVLREVARAMRAEREALAPRAPERLDFDFEIAELERTAKRLAK